MEDTGHLLVCLRSPSQIRYWIVSVSEKKRSDSSHSNVAFGDRYIYPLVGKIDIGHGQMPQDVGLCLA